MDSPQVHPLDAVYWEDTQELILPPVVMLPTHYRDLRRRLWEPRQPTRFVPIIHGTQILCDVAISMHTDPAELIRRVEAMRMEPPRVHLAVFPQYIWVLFLSHADPVPPLVRARGGMRPMPGAAHHTLTSSLGSSGTTPTSLSWSIDRTGQPYPTSMNFLQAEQAQPTQLVKIMLPAQAPREVLITTNVDMEEEDMLRQAAHRFALSPTRVTLKGAVPLERLQHGDTLILPIKVKFPSWRPGIAGLSPLHGFVDLRLKQSTSFRHHGQFSACIRSSRKRITFIHIPLQSIGRAFRFINKGRPSLSPSSLRLPLT